ncbi:hypothetical protein ACB496_15375 [Lelliottia nimipressuralis]|uniref:hypothetical protein n=1 Tax=Lelliottia nimipressuralis TaxID=69220 RepID=UPI003557FFD8
MTKTGTGVAVSLLLGWLMAGNVQAATDAAPAGAGHSAAMDSLYGQRMDVCLNELNTLKNVDQAGYDRQARALNAEMTRAVRYLLQRDQLNQEMRSVMDKLYQARLTGQCQSVHNTLFDVLLVQANGGEVRAGGDK